MATMQVRERSESRRSMFNRVLTSSSHSVGSLLVCKSGRDFGLAELSQVNKEDMNLDISKTSQTEQQDSTTIPAVCQSPPISSPSCITTFNRARFIRATLDIFAPLKSNCEVVVVDGTAGDKTECFLSKHVRRFDNLRYIRQRKNLTVAARQDRRGLRSTAAAQHIQPLDAMTRWFSRLLPESKHCAVKNHPPIVYHLVERRRWLPMPGCCWSERASRRNLAIGQSVSNRNARGCF